MIEDLLSNLSLPTSVVIYSEIITSELISLCSMLKYISKLLAIIHLSSKLCLRIYHVPGRVLGTRDPKVDKTGPYLQSGHCLMGKQIGK